MPKWTKQTYEMVAAVLHEAYKEYEWVPEVQLAPIDSIVELFADRFKRDNARFDGDKFQTAAETGKHIRSSLKG